MEYIYVGKIVNTHGIKGEIRILSDFKYKNEIFKENFKLYIGTQKQEMIIKNYRKHKMYDMVLFYDINDINEVLKYKGQSVYINKDDIKVDEYFFEDLINLEVYSNDKLIGNVTDIVTSKAHEILVIEKNKKKILIPNIKPFIEKTDLENKKIYINEIEGLIDEN